MYYNIGIEHSKFIRHIFSFHLQGISLDVLKIIGIILVITFSWWKSVLISEKLCSWYYPDSCWDMFFTYVQRILTLHKSNTFSYALVVSVHTAFSTQVLSLFTYLSKDTCLTPKNMYEAKPGWEIKDQKAIYRHSLAQIQLHGYAWGVYLLLHRLNSISNSCGLFNQTEVWLARSSFRLHMTLELISILAEFRN